MFTKGNKIVVIAICLVIVNVMNTKAVTKFFLIHAAELTSSMVSFPDAIFLSLVEFSQA